MSIWGQLTQQQGQELANRLSAYRPFVGRVVRVAEGRKHKGKIGRVTWHGVDKFSQAFRYGDASLTEVIGRHGYRVGIEMENGERFFVPASYTMVCVL